MPENQPITGNVLGSEIPRSLLHQLRDMITAASWESFCEILNNHVKMECANILGGDSPTDEELHALSGTWKLLEVMACQFPAEVAGALEDIAQREREAAQK